MQRLTLLFVASFCLTVAILTTSVDSSRVPLHSNSNPDPWNPASIWTQATHHQHDEHRRTGARRVGDRLDVEYVRRLLELVEVGPDTPLGAILANGEVPKQVYELVERLERLSVDDVIEEFVEQMEDLAIVRKQLQEYVERQKQRPSDQPPSEWPVLTVLPPWTPPENQSECTKDYSQFVDPITNKLWNLVRDAVCEIVPQTCDLVVPPVPNTTMPAWGRPMIDAMGKIPEGLSEVKLHFVGAFDMCNDIKVVYNYTDTSNTITERKFNGQYCRINLTPSYESLNATQNITIPLQLGICVPSTCSREDVRNYIMVDNKFLSSFLKYVLGGTTVTYVYCGMELNKATDVPFQTAIGIILVCVILGIIATIYDGCFRKKILEKYVKKVQVKTDSHRAKPVATVTHDNAAYRAPSGDVRAELPNYHPVDDRDLTRVAYSPYTPRPEVVDRSSSGVEILSDSGSELVDVLDNEKIGVLERLELFLVGFSYYSNIRKIFNTRSIPDQIPVLHGIRYLSYAWTIFGNTYLFGPIYHECYVSANTVSAATRLPKQFKFQAVLNYHLAMDSFFVISGILMSYWFLKKVAANNGHVTVWMVLLSIFHRYWRLMPGLALTLMFYTCTYRYLADGPMFPQNVGDADNCRVNWWVDILMVHNLVRTEYMCLTWMFCAPLVFQLHLAALVVLVPYVLKPVVGYVLMVVMYIAHIIATAILTTGYRTNSDTVNLFRGYLMTPWCRAGPFIIGLAIGIFMQRRSSVKMHWAVVLVGWVVALLTMLATVFSSYSFLKEGGEPWSPEAHAAYDTLARSAWGLAIGWFVVACHYGYGGVVDRFLSWKLFWPLSRLVYFSFLTSALMIFRYAYTNRILLYVSEFHMFYLTLGNIVYVMLMGLVFSLMWHYPITMGVERTWLCRTKLEWMREGRHPSSVHRTDYLDEEDTSGEDDNERKSSADDDDRHTKRL